MPKIISTNPAKNYSEIGSVTITSETEIIAKVAAANQMNDAWKNTSITRRIELVGKIWELCKERANEIAQLITREVGTPITASMDEVLWNKGYFEWFLSHVEEAVSPIVTGKDNATIHTVFYEPIGTAAVITPWNLPFDMFVWGVIPNLLVGNTVVYKAAEECALTGKLLEEICSEAGLPDGVLSFVHGGAVEGAMLVDQHIDLIWFTGSTDVGQKLYKKGAEKFIKVILEMGGSNPVIVFDDADIDSTVNSIVTKRFMFCGQTCDADKRLLVQESVIEKVTEKLKEKISKMIPGDPEQTETQIGPLVSKKQLELLESQVEDSVKLGAVVLAGGRALGKSQGAYYLPTLLNNVSKDMRVWNEEVFGPVLPIMPFTTEKEAITLANDTQYGLGSQVYTNDPDRALRVAGQLKAGNVDINGVGHFHPFNPFGGYKKSGIGREHGLDGFRELCQIKVVSRKI